MTEQKEFNLTREQAIKLICKITNQDDPYWENLLDDYYDEESDTMPKMFDVLRPLGITEAEIKTAEGYDK